MPTDDALNRRVEFFAELYDQLTDEPVDEALLRQELLDRGIDVDAVVAAGMKLLLRHSRHWREITDD